MGFDDLIHDGEPDACALNAEAAGLLAAAEAAEDGRLLVSGDADAVVANRNADTFVTTFQTDFHAILAGRVFYGIFEQIPDGAGNGFAIDLGLERALAVDIDFVSGDLSVAAEILDSAPDEFDAIAPLEPVRARSGFHAAEIQQRFYEARQTVGSARLSLVADAAAISREFIVIAKHIRELAQSGERRSKFMRDGGHKVGLEARDC